MKSDVNRWTGTGRLTRNPELRKTPSGVAVCDISMACNRYSSEGKQFTTYARVTVWNKQAEFLGDAESGLKVGDFIYVEGPLVDDNFETTKGDSSTKTSGRLKVDNALVKILARKQVRLETSTEEAQSDPE